MTKNLLNTKISEIQHKIPNTSSLVTTTVLNMKVMEVENKIPDNSKDINSNKLRARKF